MNFEMYSGTAGPLCSQDCNDRNSGRDVTNLDAGS